MLTPYPPKVSPNARYSLKEAAGLLGVHPNTVSNYTKRGAIRVQYSKANGRPRYLGSDILKLWEETI